MADKESYSIKELGHILNVSERSAWTYIAKYGIRKEYLHTERGREVRICAEEVQRLQNLLSDRVQGFTESECTGIGYSSTSIVPTKEGVKEFLSLIPRDEVVEILREAFLKALQDHDSTQKKQNLAEATIGRWTLFTGAALVTVMAVIAMAIMQHTLAIA